MLAVPSDGGRVLMADDATNLASRSQYGQSRFVQILNNASGANINLPQAFLSQRAVARTSIDTSQPILRPAIEARISSSGTATSYNMQPFPTYVPGQMPFDFLSLPLVPFLQDGISNFRPQLGSLPAPRAPLRTAPFPYQPSWTDSLVEEMKRDPTWDSRLSFVAIPPGDFLPEAKMDENLGLKRGTQSRITYEQRDRFSAQPNPGYDNRPAAAPNANRQPPADVSNRDVSPTVEKQDQHVRSPPTPRVLNPKPVGAFAEEDKTNTKNADPRNAGLGANRDRISNPPRNFAGPSASKPTTSNGAPSFGKAVNSSPANRAVKKDSLKNGSQTDASKDSSAGGGLAARLSAYMQATKNQ